MSAMGERWEFLRPWCAPVRGKLMLGFRYNARVPSTTYDSIEVALPKEERTATPETLGTIRSALILLTLLARVDHSSWKYVLAEHCDLDLKHREMYTNEDAFRQPRFKLAFNERELSDKAWLVTMLRQLFSQLDTPPSSMFATTAGEILSRGADRLAQHERLDIPISVRVWAAYDRRAKHLERM